MEFKYYNIKEIQNYLKENNLVLQKKFGQNFLVDIKVANRIIDKLETSENDLVIEIGCGLGSLTNLILKNKCKVIGFELDRSYCKVLNDQFKNDNFELIEGDFLKKADAVFNSINRNEYKNIKIVGNIPYNITKEIFEKIFTSKIEFDSVCLMVQKEVFERISAKPNTKKYSYFSILSQFNKEFEIVLNLSADYFFPRPNVDSAVILFKKKIIYQIDNLDNFLKFSKSIFVQRRKMLLNNFVLSTNFISKEKLSEILNKLEILNDVRGESLSIEQLINISNEISKTQKIL